MFEVLTDRLQGVLQKISGNDRLTGENVDAALYEVRKALIEADVSLKAIKLFLDRVRKAAVGERVMQGLTPAQKFIQVVHLELVNLLGGTVEPIKIVGKPAIIMLLGLQGSGKTTTAAKLALSLVARRLKVMLVALDLQRPAAVLQLSILAEQVGVPVFTSPGVSDPIVVAEEAVKRATADGVEVLIFDTAGRLQVDSDLMAELLIIERKFKPAEKLLVIDSLMGQEAVNVAQAFDTQIGITGSILTKLDGDSRGGAALSIVEGTGKKIKFIGRGEKVEPLEEFAPDRLADRILGYGDVVALVRSVEENVNREEAAEMAKRLGKGELNFESFLKMQRMISGMGNISGLFGMLGLNGMLGMNREQREEAFKATEGRLKQFEFAIQSMTAAERRTPRLLQERSRQARVAGGAGLAIEQVTQMVKEFEQMQHMVKTLAPMMSAGGANPQNIAAISQKMRKTQKQQKQNVKTDGPFGGGSFMKF